MAYSELTKAPRQFATDGRRGEREVKRRIEDLDFEVQDANIIFRANCPNIDLVVYGRTGAIYVQVKSSEHPAGKDMVVVDGSPWTEEQLKGGAIFNKRADRYQASLVVVVHRQKGGTTEYYVAPPDELERPLRERGNWWADTPKRDGSRRSIQFRKELSRAALAGWLNAWDALGEPCTRRDDV